jgi:hypothetical protein
MLNQGGTVIEYNEIHHVSRGTRDNGPVYYASLNREAANSYILDTWMHDSPGELPANGTQAGRMQQFGVYLDLYSNHVLVKNTLMERMNGIQHYVHCHGSTGVFRNTIIDGEHTYWEADPQRVRPFAERMPAKNYPEPDEPIDTAQIGLQGAAQHDIPEKALTRRGFVADYFEDPSAVEVRGEWEDKEFQLARHPTNVRRRSLVHLAPGSAGAYVRFRCHLDQAGSYAVYVYYTSEEGAGATNTPVTIRHSGGEETALVDQLNRDWVSSNGYKTGLGVLVGTFALPSGEVSVTVGTEGTDGPVYARGVAVVDTTSVSTGY